MTQADVPVSNDDEGWWKALSPGPSQIHTSKSHAAEELSPLATPDLRFARQLGDALRRQSELEQQAEIPSADPAEDARRRAALLDRAQRAGLLAPRSDAATSLPVAGEQGKDVKAQDPPVAHAPSTPSSQPVYVRRPTTAAGVAGARRWPGLLLTLAVLTSGALVAALWSAGRMAGVPGALPAEVLRGSAILEMRFERQDAAQAARQAQAALEAAGLAVEASRRPDERGFAWVLEFEAPTAPVVAAASGPASALAALTTLRTLGLPAWQPGLQRWVFRPPAPLQREGAASKATNPAQ